MRVLGYSENGVYVHVHNEYAEMVVDFNTTTGDCVEVEDRASVDCDYHLSVHEKKVINKFFNAVLDEEG